MIILHAGAFHLFSAAVKLLLSDGRFKVQTSQAVSAREIASALIALWGEDPHKHPSSTEFAFHLVRQLKTCFNSQQKSLHLRKERMWGMYHQLRTSNAFKCEWKEYLESCVKASASPCFYQYVTNELFKDLIKLEFPLPTAVTQVDHSATPSLTEMEKNALRYVAGYVCRKVRDNLKKSSCKISNKHTMIQCLEEINGETDEDCDTEEWIRLIDRGGLWQVNDDVFGLFLTMEEEISQKLKRVSASELKESTKAEILDSLLKNEDLLFQWCFIIRTTVDNDSSPILLKQIVELYLTVRGFAFATSCLELYKQAHKKTLQKKKPLRKKLCINE